ncbi:hypothetical protein LE181_08400 [Streptomyces sp. SCA3-4]|uniref:hypothetical protein n=1 Tax=Streptomyces sichuanensis TaxID=2871810 RepID=UPI001CE32582|nr:hypothetical protein [Streptomyces sichuanensis]MCA6092179.1 hypothetical protein [Streptomyces sichuanensis]
MHALAWALATAAAMAVSWYGVRTVLAGTAYEPPRALPISGSAAPAVGEPASIGEPASSARASGPPDSSPSLPAPATAAPSAERSPAATPGASRKPGAPPPPGGGEVKSFAVRGGRAVFDLGPGAATLVSAAPDEGWQMRVWKQSAWIRVDFVSDARTTSVFVTWNGHPPQVQTVEG